MLNSADAARMIERCDLALFQIVSQTSERDKRTLLLLQNAVRQVAPDGYKYVEVGSYRGGSLVPHLADPRCRFVCSIDPRPTEAPDGRGIAITDVITTARMIEGLAQYLEPSAMLKLQTFDADAATVNPAFQFDFAFVDAEHTNEAVFRDFLAVRKMVKPDAVIAFHDTAIVFEGILNIEAMLRDQGADFATMILPDSITVLLFGEYVELVGGSLSRLAVDKTAYIAHARRWLYQQIAASQAKIAAD